MKVDLKNILINDLQKNINIVDDVIEIIKKKQGQLDSTFNVKVTMIVNDLKKELNELPFSDIEIELLKVELANKFKTILTFLEN